MGLSAKKTQKYLVMSKKSSTFAPAFEKQCPLVYRYYTGFWFREARFDSSVDNKGCFGSLFFPQKRSECDGILGIK